MTCTSLSKTKAKRAKPNDLYCVTMETDWDAFVSEMNAIIILPQCGNQRLIHRGCHHYYRVQHRVTKTTAGVKVRSRHHACFNIFFFFCCYCCVFDSVFFPLVCFSFLLDRLDPNCDTHFVSLFTL